MKKLLLSLMVICTCTLTYAQKISDFSVVSLLKQGNPDSITHAVAGFITTQFNREHDSLFDAYAKKYQTVDDYRNFLLRTINNDLMTFCFRAYIDLSHEEPFKNFGMVYYGIEDASGTFTQERARFELAYSISKSFNSLDGIRAIIGNKKVSNEQNKKLYGLLDRNQRESEALLFKVSMAYSECLAALDLQRMPESDRIAIKKALFMATPHITNL